ncbi:MAG: cysteine--tRNA ligase [Bacilli bacterium]
MKIYNSLTNKLEDFKQIKPGEVSMYVCGSTVYNDIHIGNSRPVVFFDVVVRFFKYLGNKVYFVTNFTDIDDKIIKKAMQEGVEESVISERYIKSIMKTYDMLNCQKAYKYPKVTETMDDIIEFIEQLVEKGGAYVVDHDVYFDITKADHYGILSNQTVAELINGARIEANSKKKNPCDFNLWKQTEFGKKWDSPWGEGRPGWHTECVVMIRDIFKSMIDIHGGGMDLKFPHHDNEIAQSTVVDHTNIANYWVHNGRVDINGKKMSKSLGNVIWAKDLVEKIGYGPYRLLLLNVPYRQPMNYNEEMLSQAQGDYEKMTNIKNTLANKLQLEAGIVDYTTKLQEDSICALEHEFISAMSDDFNTANAITVIYQTMKMMNRIVRQKVLNVEETKEILTLLDKEMWVLGIEFTHYPLSPADIELVKAWEKARADKDFKKADQLRQNIIEKDIKI